MNRLGKIIAIGIAMEITYVLGPAMDNLPDGSGMSVTLIAGSRQAEAAQKKFNCNQFEQVPVRIEALKNLQATGFVSIDMMGNESYLNTDRDKTHTMEVHAVFNLDGTGTLVWNIVGESNAFQKDFTWHQKSMKAVTLKSEGEEFAKVTMYRDPTRNEMLWLKWDEPQSGVTWMY